MATNPDAMKVGAVVASGLLLAACGRDAVRAAEGPRLPAGWVAVAPPAAGSEGESCANYADDAWAPALGAAGRLAAIHRVPDERDADTAVVPGGRLVAADHGEFGGELRWEPAGAAPVRVARLNFRAFARTSRSLLGLVGLAHLGGDYGEVVRLQQGVDGRWAVRPLFELGSSPQAFSLLPGDTLLIATMQGVSTATEGGGARVLHRAPQWGLTYPNSVARDADGVVYVGMRSAVARLRPAASGYAEDWLVRTSCVVRRHRPKDDLECDCVESGR